MKIDAEKKTITFAEVYHYFRDYRVWPNGKVEIWEVSDCDVNGYWKDLESYENEFEDVREAGLEVLK